MPEKARSCGPSRRRGPDRCVRSAWRVRALSPGRVGSAVRHPRPTRAVARANERHACEEQLLIPEQLSPHSLRRTFASLLYFRGENPVYVMHQMGHTDPKLALRIYQRSWATNVIEARESVWWPFSGVSKGHNWAQVPRSS